MYAPFQYSLFRLLRQKLYLQFHQYSLGALYHATGQHLIELIKNVDVPSVGTGQAYNRQPTACRPHGQAHTAGGPRLEA